MRCARRCLRCPCHSDDSYSRASDRDSQAGVGFPTMPGITASVLSTISMLILADVSGLARFEADDPWLVAWVFAAVLIAAGVYITTAARAIHVMLNGNVPLDLVQTKKDVPWRFICGLLDSVIAVVFVTALCSTAVILASPGNSQIRCGPLCSPRGMSEEAIFPIVQTWGLMLLYTFTVTVHSSPGGILVIGAAAVCLFAAHALTVFIAYVTFLIASMIRISTSANARDFDELTAIRQGDQYDF
jgi:hypothetical protein